MLSGINYRSIQIYWEHTQLGVNTDNSILDWRVKYILQGGNEGDGRLLTKYTTIYTLTSIIPHIFFFGHKRCVHYLIKTKNGRVPY